MSKREPYELASQVDDDGPQFWRSLEERAKRGDPELRKELEAEFPKGHTSTPPSEESAMVGRRGFLTLSAAALALAGAEGCRRPLDKIVPYQKMPEQVIPGVPSHYATVYGRRGEAIGLLVESHEGRPTKVEGNPSHPTSLGGADLLTQASILDLYDMDRSTGAVSKGADKSVDEAMGALKDALAKAGQGDKLRVLMQPTNSPSVLRMRKAIALRFPKAKMHTYAPVNESSLREGTRIAFGKPMQALYAYDQANVIVSLDSDFLQTEAGNVRATKLFAARRRLRSTQDTMSRLYVIEPMLSVTGSNADHRFRVAAADVAGIAIALAAQLASAHNVRVGDIVAGQKTPPEAAAWIPAIAKDLAAAGGRAIVVAGSRQPPLVHALVAAINDALGAVGRTVLYTDVTDVDEIDNAADVADLAQALAAKQVDALVILGGNPAYDAPADLKIADLLASVPMSFHVSSHFDETSDKCTWHVPRAHEYEAWGDQRSSDGTVSIQQPLVAPLHGGVSDLEVLAVLANATSTKGYDVVRESARGGWLVGKQYTDCATTKPGEDECKDASGGKIPVFARDWDKDWNKALRDGVLVKGNAAAAARPAVSAANVTAAVAKRTLGAPLGPDSLEVTFAPCSKLFDGRHANNVWLLELPEPMTKISWDNVALLHPQTAQKLGVASGDMVKLTAGDRTITLPAWIFPGQAASSIGLTLGWGRKKGGRLAEGRGFDVYPLRASTAMGFATGVKLSKTGETFTVAQTQDHNSMEGRAIARDATLAEYKAQPNFADLQSPPPRSLPLWKDQDYSKGHQWGMSIDLNACTGCNACVIACQSENNIPSVGKIELARGREMQWIRLDRYFVEDDRHGATIDDPAIAHLPLACVHCEEAPCENVCPVNATVHSPEGRNEMAYNRCIGTRYCANNCPYKVRRFNYLNWHNDAVWKKENGLPETLQMQQNPNVTVRFRGVMEKCTYCVQRIQTVKINAKRENREIKDGEIVTACAQTCPADAIVFGDVNDPKSKVSELTMRDRRYALLAELGTKPRTTYLGKVRNPNPELVRAPAPSPGGAGAPEHKEHG